MTAASRSEQDSPRSATDIRAGGRVTAGGQAVRSGGASGESGRAPAPPLADLEPAVGRQRTGGIPTRSRHLSRYLYRVVAAEVSRFTRYFDRLIQWEPAPQDPLVLLDAIDCPEKSVARTLDDLPDFSCDREQRAAVLLNGNFNYDLDIQATLTRLRLKLGRTSRVVVIAYNSYLRWLYSVADALGLRNAPAVKTFLTRTDLDGLARLAGYEVLRLRPAGYGPFAMLRLGRLLNWWLPAVPGLRWLAFVVVAVLRPLPREARRPSVSIVIPARNEKGNIENALKRMPDLGPSAWRSCSWKATPETTRGPRSCVRRTSTGDASRSRRSSRQARASPTPCAWAFSKARARCSWFSTPI